MDFEVHPVALILVLVLLPLLMAWAAPRRYQIRVTRELPAAPERVWAWLEDPARYAEWFPHVAECRHSGGPERGVGQRRKLRLEFDGTPGEREEEATTWEPGRLLILQHRWEKRGGRFVRWTEAQSEFHLDPGEDGRSTRVKGVLWFTGVGMVGRIAALLAERKRHEAQYRVALDRLAERLGSEVSSAPAPNPSAPRD